MICKLLRRWASDTHRNQVERLQSDLDASKRCLKVLQTEADSMAAVIARDRERIKAEGACYARQRAEAEVTPGEQRTRQGVE